MRAHFWVVMRNTHSLLLNKQKDIICGHVRKEVRVQRSGIDKILTTPEPGYQWESDKLIVRHHKREPRGQQVTTKHI